MRSELDGSSITNALWIADIHPEQIFDEGKPTEEKQPLIAKNMRQMQIRRQHSLSLIYQQ